MTSEFTLNINRRPFKTKPNNFETAMIQKNFKTETMHLSQLRTLLLLGATVKPAVLNEKGLFESQQIFFVDVDKDVSVHKNLMKGLKMGIYPSLAYRTFTGTVKNQKHRLAFLFEEPVTDVRERDELQEKLNSIFGGDKSCNNLNRIFYGGNAQYFFNPVFYTDIKKVKEAEICD